jgi:hypothetical protein
MFIGLNSSHLVVLVIFGMGTTTDVFHESGTTPDNNDVLIMSSNVLPMLSKETFII